MARRQGFGLLAASWPLLACFASLLALDLAGLGPAPGAPGAGVSFLLVLLLAFAALWWGLRRLGAEPDSRRAVPVAGVLAVAVVLRLLALPLTPSLSDDVYRYLWDGRVAASGANPYLLTPDDESLAELRDDLWRKTAHRDVATVYPPLALAMFAGAAVLPGPLLASPLVVAEAAYLIGRHLGTIAESAFMRSIAAGEITMEALTAAELVAVSDLIDRYSDLGLGATDASVVVLAARHEIRRIATLDRRHFSVVRTMAGKSFELVP